MGSIMELYNHEGGNTLIDLFRMFSCENKQRFFKNQSIYFRCISWEKMLELANRQEDELIIDNRCKERVTNTIRRLLLLILKDGEPLLINQWFYFNPIGDKQQLIVFTEKSKSILSNYATKYDVINAISLNKAMLFQEIITWVNRGYRYDYITPALLNDLLTELISTKEVDKIGHRYYLS